MVHVSNEEYYEKTCWFLLWLVNIVFSGLAYITLINISSVHAVHTQPSLETNGDTYKFHLRLASSDPDKHEEVLEIN